MNQWQGCSSSERANDARWNAQPLRSTQVEFKRRLCDALRRRRVAPNRQGVVTYVRRSHGASRAPEDT